MKQIVVTGSFDNFRSAHIRLLDEASRLGAVHVLLWDDDTARVLDGAAPKFPQEERLYIVQAMRYVSRVTVIRGWTRPDALPEVEGLRPDLWVVNESEDDSAKRAFCREHRLDLHVVKKDLLTVFPSASQEPDTRIPGRQMVIVTGCYDWFHSGHIRFFEEVSSLGDLYVVVGHDANIRLLKGEGHPLFPEAERRYVVGAVRYVRKALISSGTGWMDAEPEIAKLRPDMYAVNEDGDKPEKREFCASHGLRYVVLKRTPKEGLPRRQSTDLRGF